MNNPIPLTTAIFSDIFAILYIFVNPPSSYFMCILYRLHLVMRRSVRDTHEMIIRPIDSSSKSRPNAQSNLEPAIFQFHLHYIPAEFRSASISTERTVTAKMYNFTNDPTSSCFISTTHRLHLIVPLQVLDEQRLLHVLDHLKAFNLTTLNQDEYR